MALKLAVTSVNTLMASKISTSVATEVEILEAIRVFTDVTANLRAITPAKDLLA